MHHRPTRLRPRLVLLTGPTGLPSKVLSSFAWAPAEWLDVGAPSWQGGQGFSSSRIVFTLFQLLFSSFRPVSLVTSCYASSLPFFPRSPLSVSLLLAFSSLLFYLFPAPLLDHARLSGRAPRWDRSPPLGQPFPARGIELQRDLSILQQLGQAAVLWNVGMSTDRQRLALAAQTMEQRCLVDAVGFWAGNAAPKERMGPRSVDITFPLDGLLTVLSPCVDSDEELRSAVFEGSVAISTLRNRPCAPVPPALPSSSTCQHTCEPSGAPSRSRPNSTPDTGIAVRPR